MKTKIALLSLLGLLLCGSALADVYSLDQLLELARSGNRGLQASRDAVEAARSGVTTAGAFPNPEIEYQSGDAKARVAGANPGNVKTMTFTQRLDLPWVRSARI
ncbi:MAG: TolC family protein, partial [Azospira sp.]|nr:TolC family protein [Azospira sp.]